MSNILKSGIMRFIGKADTFFINVGFNIRNTIVDIQKNWFLILLVGVVIPITIFFIGKFFIPKYIKHVVSRLPLNINELIPTLINITIGTFLEEVIYRVLVQQGIAKFTGNPMAIIAASVIFAFMHFSKGKILIVSYDILGVFIDSIVYGIIFAKTKNVFASWTGHYLSDLVGLIFILYFK